MNRIAGLLVLLAAGFLIADAWAASPPIVIGTNAPMTSTAVASTTSPTPSPSPFASSASLTVSNNRAGDRPVSMTLKLHYEMQCGSPGPGALVVTLPSSEQVPAHFSTSAALLDGKHVAIRIASGKLRVSVPPPPRVMCDVIGPGTLTLQLTKAANLGNPAQPGSYVVVARKSSRTFEATLHITQ
jgi:hypothetical protein